MSELVKIYLSGKCFSVPKELTVMRAMEYAGFKLVKNCGCRNGFCGACRVSYHIDGEKGEKTCLACKTVVKDNMYITVSETSPFKVLEKTVSFETKSLTALFPEIDNCIACGLCNKTCPLGIDVLGYISAAKDGDFKKCAELSFDCVMCGACAEKCPARINQPKVAMTARRINGKKLSRKNFELLERIDQINSGKLSDDVDFLLNCGEEKIKELYNSRGREE